VREHRDPQTLGVHPARVRGGEFTGFPAYVPRDVHEAVAAAIERPGLVVIEGTALAGKTRLAYEVLQQVLPDRPLVVPRGVAAIRELCREPDRMADAVIWLDSAEHSLSCGALEEAVDGFQGTDAVLLATLDCARVSIGALCGTDSPLREASVIHVSDEATETERARAEAHRADPRIAEWLDLPIPDRAERLATGAQLVGLGAHLAAGRVAVQRWHSAVGGAQVTAGAIISAAVAARGNGIVGPIGWALLAELYPMYLAADEETDVAAALVWALQPAVPGAPGCLRRVSGEPDAYEPLSYLIDEAVRTYARTALPTPAWQILLHHADDGEARLVGLYAESVRTVSAGPDDLAVRSAVTERAYRRAASAGNRRAMADLGRLLGNRQRYDEAEHWYREAIVRGDLLAANDLGSMHAEIRRRDPTAETRFDLQGDEVCTMYALGSHDVEYEFVDEIERRLRSVRVDDSEALYEIGEALYGAETFPQEAKLWLHRAAELGHAEAMCDLGKIYEAGDRPADAAHWYRRAADAGLGRAMYDLGCLYETQGNRNAAARWHQEGIKAGEQRCLKRLGDLLIRAGHRDKAQQLYRGALRHGHPDAQRLLDALTGGP
jgi:TPR repeat protein